MAKKTHEDLEKNFLKKLKENNKFYRNGDFNVLCIRKEVEYKVYTENKYGICISNYYDLLNGRNISINTAIDKNSYFKNYFKFKNPKVADIIKPISNYITGNTKMDFKHRLGTVSITPVDVLRLRIITIQSAKNKTTFFLNEIKERRDDFLNIDYSNFRFESYYKKEIFRCKKHNIKYKQSLTSHKRGNQGCSKCAKGITYYDENTVELMSNKFGKIYFIKLSNNEEVFYKIGITGKDSNKRIRAYRKFYEVELLLEIESNIRDSYKLEQLLILNYKKYSYIPKKHFKGYSECFKENPVNFYKEMYSNFKEEEIQNNKNMCEEYGINYENNLIP